ncbi:DnaJ homolog subfamily C member 17 [Lemmus lemmus]
MKKAYRRRTLSCHPVKNPLFHQLSGALELTDAAARAAYDKERQAKEQAAERTHTRAGDCRAFEKRLPVSWRSSKGWSRSRSARTESRG